ncbi:MAG: DUF1203 domain-containing protein [Alphaproteobacteria bacterium]|nr:DUF1203 domain-containing protein [Alphaproteobacteria bacterium]TAD88486.1 MAG: DUF1203 domain-containing protein [Alphaproteobacteria bacterium]
MDFRITGLDPAPFAPLFGLSDEALAARGAVRYVVTEQPGFPDRVEMREGRLGETMLLVNHVSLDQPTPYRATHAIFVREGATTPFDAINTVPEVMRRRLLSVRGFDPTGMLRDADVVEGTALEAVIDRLFADPAIAFLHVHNAKQGCYSGRVDRVA